MLTFAKLLKREEMEVTKIITLKELRIKYQYVITVVQFYLLQNP
jgi:hypothetical protein